MCEPGLSRCPDRMLNQLPLSIQTVGDDEMDKLHMKSIRAKFSLVVVMATVLASCAVTPLPKCTSDDRLVCNLQDRVHNLEQRHAIDNKHPAREMSDQELVDELRRRRKAVTYPTQ